MKIRSFLLTLAALTVTQTSKKLTVTRLTCNYQGDPAAPESGCINVMAVTEDDIRLRWQMAATDNGLTDDANRIIVKCCCQTNAVMTFQKQTP